MRRDPENVSQNAIIGNYGVKESFYGIFQRSTELVSEWITYVDYIIYKRKKQFDLSGCTPIESKISLIKG